MTHGVSNRVNMHAHDDNPKGNQGAFHVHDGGMCVVPTESHHS